jgi:hypothetical protein
MSTFAARDARRIPGIVGPPPTASVFRTNHRLLFSTLCVPILVQFLPCGFCPMHNDTRLTSILHACLVLTIVVSILTCSRRPLTDRGVYLFDLFIKIQVHSERVALIPVLPWGTVLMTVLVPYTCPDHVPGSDRYMLYGTHTVTLSGLPQ